MYAGRFYPGGAPNGESKGYNTSIMHTPYAPCCRTRATPATKYALCIHTYCTTGVMLRCTWWFFVFRLRRKEDPYFYILCRLTYDTAHQLVWQEQHYVWAWTCNNEIALGRSLNDQ